MSVLIGPLLNTFLSLFAGAFIRCYPLRDKLRVSLKSLIGIYALVFLLECVIFMSFREYFAVNFLGNQVFKVLTGVLIILIPVFAARGSIFQNLFLIFAVAHYVIVVFGAGNFVELTWGGAFAQTYPYLICDGAVILLSIPILPFTLKALNRLFGLLPEKSALVWKYIWIIPAMFAALCFMAANVFMGEEAVSAAFILVRIFTVVGMIATCLLLARTLKQEADNAAMTERARMTESILDVQREQYGRITQNIEQTNAARHDMRHQLAAIGRMTDEDTVKSYLAELLGALPEAPEQGYCANYAVNAVVTHYLATAVSEKVATDVRLAIPERAGRVSDMDLCVIMGNLLENAVEACLRIEGGERFIRARAGIEGVYLSMIVENSFDGLWNERNGTYLSRKHDGEALREGVGLSSVKAVCAKYNGLVKIEVIGKVWRSSALVTLGE